MPRKPFFREFDGWWYAQVKVGTKRKQVKLAKGRDNEQEAYRTFCHLMAEDPAAAPASAAVLVAIVCDLFLEYSHRHHEAETYEWYRYFL